MASTPVLIGAFLEVLNEPWYIWIDWESGTFSYREGQARPARQPPLPRRQADQRQEFFRQATS
ncbi:hypothetical protein [Nonomuraea rubra]|uniref:Uncharacterized protein n=1 Tax=Nonomuraea rubra TaxID=46180 RepID=A0A7X0NY99_9ACTN|nr:hypothetical protein [Nonomuraea rubra]MBB6551767.1 hypothetical protein [Nonomuraea rubra]